MRGGKRHHHVPTVLTPEQVRWAAQQITAGVSAKATYLTLGVSRGALWRALAGKGGYQGILAEGDYNPRRKRGA